MNLFSSGEDEKFKEIESLVRSLEVPANIPNATLALIDLSSDPANASFICEIGLPAIFTAIIHSKLNDVTISDLFDLINNLMQDNTNAIRIIGEELALPVLIDCADTDNERKKLAVVRIITRLAIVEPSLVQKSLGNDQDRLVHFLGLINDEDSEFLTEFLNLIGILVVGNENFQQMFAFYSLDRLIQLVRAKQTGAMSALRAILSANSNTQTLFFESNQLDAIAPLLETGDPETMALLIDLFSGEKASKFRDSLKGSKIFEVVFEKAKEGSEQYVRLLGLLVRGNDELSKGIEDGIGELLGMYLRSTDDLSDLFFLSFFKNYLYKVESNAMKLVDCIVQVDDRNSQKLIELATMSLIMCKESRAVFIDSANSFVISMIGFLISGLNLEHVLPFLIAFCYRSNAAASEVINESSQPLTFVFEMLSREDLGKLVHAQLCLFVKVLLPFMSEVPETVSVEQIDETLKDFAIYLSTLEKTDALSYEESVIKELFDEGHQEVPVEAQSEEAHREAEVVPPEEHLELAMPEERKEVNFDAMKDEIHGDNMESVVENYERMFEQMRQELLEQKLYYEEEMRKMVEQSKLLALRATASDSEMYKSASESMQAQMLSLREQLNHEKEQLIDQHGKEIQTEREISKKDIDMWRRKCDEAQSTVDALKVSHQREVTELRNDLLAKEMWYQSEVQKLKNANNERISSVSSDLKRDCRSVMSELNMYKAQQQSLLNEQLENLREHKRKVDKIVNENGYLKFQISQLLKEKSALMNDVDALKKKVDGHAMIDAEHKLFQQQLKSAENQILELMRGTQGASPSDAMVSSYEKVQALNNDLTRQIEELRAQKESLMAENDDLKDKNSELQADLSAKDTYTENTRAELDKIKGITKKLTHERKKDKEENTKLRSDLAAAEAQIDEWRQKCEASEAKQKDIIQKEETTRKAAADNEKQIAELKQKISSLKADLQKVHGSKEQSVSDATNVKLKYQNVKSENRSLREQLDNIKEQHVEKIAEVNQQSQTISDLKHKITQLETENKHLQKMNDLYLERETNSSADSDKLRELSQQVIILGKDNTDLTSVSERRKAKLRDMKISAKKVQDLVQSRLNERTGLFEKRFREFTETVASHVSSANARLESTLERLPLLTAVPPQQTAEKETKIQVRRPLRLVAKEIVDITPAIRVAEEEVSEHTSSFIEFNVSAPIAHDCVEGEDRIALLEAANHDLRRDQRKLEKTNKTLRGQNEELKRSTETLRTKNEELNRSTETLRSENEEFKRSTETLRSENEKLKRSTETLRSDNEKLKRSTETLRSKNEELKRSTETLGSQNKELKRSAETLRSENEKLKRSTETLRSKNEELKRSTETLRAKNEELQRSTETIGTQNEELKRLTDTLCGQNDELKRSIETLKKSKQKESKCSQCGVLRSRNSEMKEKLATAQEQTISLLTQNKELLKQITDLNLCLANSGVDGETASLKVELQARDEENKRLREELHLIKTENMKALRDRTSEDILSFGSPRDPTHRKSLPSKSRRMKPL